MIRPPSIGASSSFVLGSPLVRARTSQLPGCEASAPASRDVGAELPHALMRTAVARLTTAEEATFRRVIADPFQDLAR